MEAILFMPGTGAYGADAVGKLIAGTINPSGHLADTTAYVDYVEGIYVGYQYCETASGIGRTRPVRTSRPCWKRC